MAEERERFSLSRWSRRKLDSHRDPAAPDAPAQPTAAIAAVAESAPVVTPEVATPAADDAIAPPLAPVESLSIDSDFRPYFAPKVDEETKRAALRKLFSDPHFNVMDGLDVYIDDYNKPDPMPPEMLEKIVGVYDRLAAESAAQEAAEKAEAESLAARAASATDAQATGGDVAALPSDVAADDRGAAEPARAAVDLTHAAPASVTPAAHSPRALSGPGSAGVPPGRADGTLAPQREG